MASKNKEIQVIVFPYPIQGHINPMLQFSKQLASRGLSISLVTTPSYSSNLINLHPSITVDTISDGGDETATAKNFDSYIKTFDVVGPQSLSQLIGEKIELQNPNNNSIKCLVYDSCIPWALDVARKFGIYGASYFTHPCLVSLIFYQVYEGVLSAPVRESMAVEDDDELTLIEVEDMPSFVRELGICPALEELVINQFSNVGDADWRFFNTFDCLETKMVDWMSRKWPVMTIGPCIPSMYLDKRLPNDREYGLSLFQPQTDACMQWLDDRDAGTVVYISMGSLASLRNDQMQELAKGLQNCDKYFLWVVRTSEVTKLPVNFKEKTSNKGLIVNWCPQLEVLAHRALGCFVTHCGWNSTLEAISLGVPMVAFPQWSDQPTNAKCIADFWRIGVKVKVDESGLLTADEIELRIREVMEGARAKEIKSNAMKWKKHTREAMGEGGSSHSNIEEFVTKLLHS